MRKDQPTATKIANFLRDKGFRLFRSPHTREAYYARSQWWDQLGKKVLVASTIDLATGKLRAKSTDAIRVLVKDVAKDKVVFQTTFVRRDHRWRYQLLRRLNKLEDLGRFLALEAKVPVSAKKRVKLVFDVKKRLAAAEYTTPKSRKRHRVDFPNPLFARKIYDLWKPPRKRKYPLSA